MRYTKGVPRPLLVPAITEQLKIRITVGIELKNKKYAKEISISILNTIRHSNNTGLLRRFQLYFFLYDNLVRALYENI